MNSFGARHSSSRSRVLDAGQRLATDMAVDLSVPYRHATHVSGGTRGVQMMRSREDSVNRNVTTSDSSGLYIAVLHSPFSFAAENNETIRSRSELTIIHGGGDWTAHENIASSAICVTRVAAASITAPD